MAIVWNNPGQRFSFGNLDAAQQTLYEDNPSVAYQKLLAYYGQGDPNFANTTFGKFIASQQGNLNNSYLSTASQQAADWAAQKQAWDAQQSTKKGTWDQQQAAALADYNTRLAQAQSAFDTIAAQYRDPKLTHRGPELKQQYTQAMAALNQLKNNPYSTQAFTPEAWKAPGEQLTWTKYLEQNPAAAGGFANQFNEMTASQRGAQPGAFSVKRNLW